jgi:HTH-type transcriptional regulator/antitoxin HipB
MDASFLVERLGRQIASMRKARGQTLIELAADAGVTRQKLAEIERGSMTVSIHSYAKVLAALNVEISIAPARRPVFEELREVFR